MNCPAYLLVEMKNEAYSQQSSRAGIYKMQIGDFKNNQPYWIKNTNKTGLWLNGKWHFGSIDDVGTTTAGLSTRSKNSSCTHFLTTMEWEYWDGDDWVAAKAGYVKISPWRKELSSGCSKATSLKMWYF